jgi:hypothetical protein
VSDKRPPRALYRNTWSYFGGLIAAGSAALIVFALIGQLTIAQPSPYVGIFTYLVFPFILLGGLGLVLFGMWRESRRRRKAETEEASPYPRLDLNDPKQRKRFSISLVAGAIVMIALMWAGYNGYRFTGSVTFCGKLCHTVMEPEYRAYENSPHARVPCVECHVGEGAGWYVQSKLSGVRQVFAVMFNTYERPIPTPIAHLRPARETCERCHWPQKFYGAQLVQIPHFRYDEQNSPEQISLLMRTGGGAPKAGENSGIHWHMAIENKVSYVAEDRKNQVIPWFKVARADGVVTEYKAEQTQLTDAQIAAMPKHDFDCIDCHNRPSHNFKAPEGTVDRAMGGGQISPTLPWIKKVAVDALVRPYKTRNEAHDGMRKDILEFYQKDYPAILESRQGDVDGAINAVLGIYDNAVFPEMNVDWMTYPSNIGHRQWPGCFRCHDNRHVSPDGKRLSNSCTLCHTAPQRGPAVPLGEVMPKSDLGWHPWEMPAKHLEVKAHERLLCHQCHQAGFRPRQNCEDCHR